MKFLEAIPSMQHKLPVLIIAGFSILLFTPVLAQVPLSDAEKILVRSVTIIDPGKKTEDNVVHILFTQKKLELVTRDKVALESADIAFDAKGGFILGKLELGSVPGFIILDQDPRLNDDVMLDTKLHAVFAVSKGEVVLNKLLRIDVDTNEQLRSWRSYAPPPMALPLSYQNNRKWNVFRTKPINIILGGAVILESTRWLSQDSINEAQVGDINEFEGGSIRGFRAAIGGSFNFKKPWTFLFSFGTQAFERGYAQGDLNNFVLFDYRVDIPIGKATISLGKQRETISIQRLGSLIHLPSQQERASVADGLLPSRNIGIVVNSSFVNQRMTWAAGIFNNWYEVDRSFSENPTVITGRITGLPFITKDESNLLHLGIAARYSNAAGGLRYRARTEIFRGPIMIDTDLLDDSEYSFHYGLEAAWKKGPFVLIGEYIQSNVRSSTYNNPDFKGYYIVASYVLTGEVRSYNRRSGVFRKINVANEINSGGWGSLEVYGRWSSVDLTNEKIDGGKMNTLSLGVNWWPFSIIQVNINYRYSILNRFGEQGSNQGLVTRLSFVLE